jgi:oxygen-independent coproporphyrinogen-3 oxidase
LHRELATARAVVGPWAVDTVFVGGGTPSLLGAARLAEVLDAVRSTFGLAPGAEVTTESNPESTSPEFFDGLIEAGFTRVSLGMQSAAPHVLRVLERRHTPGRPSRRHGRRARRVRARQPGPDLRHTGETDDDLRASLDAVLAAGVDHVSAYALIVEDGTALARAWPAVRCPHLTTTWPRPLRADRRAADGGGSAWYEVSNWASAPEARCRHNLGYWLDGDWWGLGPGCALAPGREPVVEREAPGPLRGPARGGGSRRRPDARS